MLVGGISHILLFANFKRKKHQEELIKVATSGNKNFFRNWFSSHEIKHKENICGCAGVFNTINYIEIITQIFDQENSLAQLENFVSKNSASFYRIPFNKQKLELIKLEDPIVFQDELIEGDIKIKIYKPNLEVNWKVRRRF